MPTRYPRYKISQLLTILISKMHKDLLKPNDFVNQLLKTWAEKPYLEHWSRLRRLYNLIDSLEKKEIENKKVLDCKPDIYLSFFMQCYHLRDWLVNSESIKSHEVDKLIKDSYELGLCRNLCLGVKHYSISRPSPAELADFGDMGAKMPVFRTLSKTGERVVVLADGKVHNAFELVTACMDQWKKFLKDKKLL